MRLWALKEILRYHLGPIACFFAGHKIIWDYGNDWEMDDYCERCGHPEGKMCTTLPDYLNRAYCFLVERDWAWFRKFDRWVLGHYTWKLPDWWSY